MQPIPEEMRDVIAPLPTKSAKIRELDERGYKRADIARFLGIRYQHVRNVLEHSQRGDETCGADNGAETRVAANESICREPGDVDAVALEIGPDGRLYLPVELRDAMMLDRSGKVTARVVDGELHVIAPRVALGRAQKLARRFKKPGESMVDSFLAGRRAMWGEE